MRTHIETAVPDTSPHASSDSSKTLLSSVPNDAMPMYVEQATFMTKYDLNKNGKLDADEIAQIKSDFLADPRGDLKRLDADHDGKLSDAEAAVLAGKAQRETGKKPGAKKKKDL